MHTSILQALRRCALTGMLALLLPCAAVRAQNFSEDFTGTGTNNSWYFYNGACLTAGSSTSLVEPGPVPGCTTVMSSYYNVADAVSGKTADPSLTGGSAGYLGSSSAPGSPSAVVPDPAGSGALRFTNGQPYGYHENGAIVSSATFPTTQGLEITFKTVTYLGNSGGSGGDGADGLSFYLMDGSQPPGIGAWGGSLAYTCSNANPPYDGLVGAYLGLGIDEYGNFLNGTTNTLGETGTSATGDNTASGGGYMWNRIGLRGAGSIAWSALNGAYGTNPGSTSLPYYPASLATTCQTGTYNSTLGTCAVCSSGTYVSGTNTCDTCPSANGSGFNTTTDLCGVCPSGATYDTTYGSALTPCATCPSGYTYQNNGKCKKSSGSTTTTATWVAQTTQTPTTATPGSGKTYALLAVQNTCKTGNLFNYSSATSPTNAGAAALTNAGNTAGILDYPAIPGAYSVISGVKIANEGATKRASASPIYYDLKLTQDGKLTLSYSLSGAAYQTVIKNQPITASNGPLPNSFRFGFAGSTGGANNIHEVMCFKAVPSSESGGSTSVNEKQSAKIQTTTQAYFGYYNPTPTVWTGNLTANNLIDTNGTVTVSTTANWDGSCVLTGVASGFGTLKQCAKTGSTSAVGAEAPSSRTILSWNGSAGIPFEWGSLTTAQQNALTAGDATATADRLNYLRGDRTNEIGNTGAKEFRFRDGVLADIVDSSPTWVGPPALPYTATFKDNLYPTASTPENAVSYLSFINTYQTRQNVVYVGANDGLLHGFRSGSFDVNNIFVDNGTTPNDGQEVLAYMPNAVLQAIHSSTTPNIDFPGTQYGHSFYADATPGTGDLFYGGAWHSWLVSGLGAGGSAIFALDITNPARFSEANASSLVVGEWTPTTITCSGNTTCGNSLGNTFGTPVIRRLHNGNWGVIFGNGYGSANGDAGIYVMSIDQTTGTPTTYYLSAGNGPGNGIAYAATADLDGDHVTDYVYAGDLNGNIWRFDLTSSDPTQWKAASAPLFTAPSGQPITSDPVIASVPTSGSSPRLMIAFGTGQRTQLTNTTPTTYASGQQNLYGVWDWNLTAWNGISGAKYAALSVNPTNQTGLASPYTVAQSNLTKQTMTYNATTKVYDDTSKAICWQGSTTCSLSPDNQFGWYIALPGTQEQIIYNPTLYNGVFIVDSTVPANNVPTSCQVSLDTGYTYAVSVGSGGALASIFPQYHDTAAGGVRTDATGTPYVVKTTEGTTALVYQTVPGAPGTTQFNPPTNAASKRLTWIELR